MAQIPMISVPLKATNEIDWIHPLKHYIQHTYGDDPERYAEECATLNRLRQDMRGAGKDSTAGRDLLYRYYGQLELLDLRFPVDEQHIKISFTWFDAFTHKPTSQYSLAFEKASIIFNISAVLSCHAANQPRSEESGLKTAYHSFQASAGMFSYINENFLHAPSVDLSRDTVKTLIAITLAQAQEVFLEKQIADQKKVGLLAKLASQAGTLYSQSIEGVQENVTKAIFEKVWLLMVQIKANLLNSMAQYFQALADDDANAHGVAVGRLQAAETLAKEANKGASSFPGFVPPSSNLQADCGSLLAEYTKRHLSTVQEKLKELAKDNDYIYHQNVPPEASLAPVAKLPAAKPIPVSELYAGQDIQRITGPDLFSKIVPMAVTESASLYDEEKAKLIRAETERVDLANSEMAASLDYLRLPGALQSDIRNYREALNEASRSDAQLASKLGQNQDVFDEMRSAAQHGEVDALFQKVVSKVRGKSSGMGSPATEPNLLDADFDDSGPSVMDQIKKVEETLKKLNLIKRERNQVLKDLKEKASLLRASDSLSALMKELSMTFNNLLQDKRVRSEQSKYEAIQRQRASVVGKYKRAYQEFLDLEAGLQSAKRWYAEMKETVESLEKNVESFVNNRRSEGAQLLNQIEQERAANKIPSSNVAPVFSDPDAPIPKRLQSEHIRAHAWTYLAAADTNKFRVSRGHATWTCVTTSYAD
ncbi:putative vacuolar protein-sorting protein bro1 [Diaporthe ampelina]|uniref:BRO domain-containing protein 1 n=1 Tax=Diaporthe ampelina TaxID=1214573 RepID=A0A0G2IB13_9PEZI|nr:putative vacuolar protein-sorting protein bro1 [Diaporthe ampelina]